MGQIKINEALILLELDKRTNEAVLAAMADCLERQGYVKPSYQAAVIAREKTYATGLPTGSLGVAIPHTDIVHVNQAAIAFAVLKEPVDFVIMGEETATTPIKLVFMLAMNEQHSQLNMLQKLMKIFQDTAALNYLAAETSKTKLAAFIIKKLALEGGENE